MALPTGAITLLFSDIEGSTQRWEERPEAMALALHRHDQLLRGAIEANRGHIFKTVGDAFCAAFSHAGDGVAAALDAQRALAAEDFSAVGGLAVRIAVHSGTTHERDGDYFGPTVNRVARLLAVVHGEQVVISGETAHLLADALPEATRGAIHAGLQKHLQFIEAEDHFFAGALDKLEETIAALPR